jgi:putative ABC transport system substrate-binding protein
MQASVREVVKVKPDIILGLSPNPSDLAFLLPGNEHDPNCVRKLRPIPYGWDSSRLSPVQMATSLGFTNFEDAIGGKWIQMLKEAAPNMERAALLFNPDRVPKVFCTSLLSEQPLQTRC